MQRPPVAATSDLRFGPLRVLHRLLGHDRHVGIELRIARFNDGKLLLTSSTGDKFLFRNSVGRFRERETAELTHAGHRRCA